MLKSARQVSMAALLVGGLALSGCATTGSVKRAQASADQANQHADAVDASAKNAQSSADAAGAAAQRAQATADGATTAAQSAAQAASSSTQATNARVDALEGKVHYLQRRVTQLQHKRTKHKVHHRSTAQKTQTSPAVAAYQH